MTTSAGTAVGGERGKARRWRAVSGVAAVCVALASCISNSPVVGPATAARAAPGGSVPPIEPADPHGEAADKVASGPSGATPVLSQIPSTVVHYPDVYRPAYASVAALTDDATFIVVATLGRPAGEPEAYPLLIDESLGYGTPPELPLTVSPAEVRAAGLDVGGTYVVFYGLDTTDERSCVVGGARGVFRYDAATGAVTRLGGGASSAVPHVETLAELETAVDAADRVLASEPVHDDPPLCRAPATGL